MKMTATLTHEDVYNLIPFICAPNFDIWYAQMSFETVEDAQREYARLWNLYKATPRIDLDQALSAYFASEEE